MILPKRNLFPHQTELSTHPVSTNKSIIRIKQEIHSSARPSTWSTWLSYPPMVVSHQARKTADLLPGQSDQQGSSGTIICKNCFLKIIFSRTNQLKCVFTNGPSATSHKNLTFRLYHGNGLCAQKDGWTGASSANSIQL